MCNLSIPFEIDNCVKRRKFIASLKNSASQAFVKNIFKYLKKNTSSMREKYLLTSGKKIYFKIMLIDF